MPTGFASGLPTGRWLKARKRCDVTHGKDMALTEAWYQELKSETGERIINGLCETIQGGPLG